MTENLNPVDVAAWMRERAKQFTEMAEQIESTFKLNGQAQIDPVTPKAPVRERMEMLLMDGVKRRVGTIAREIDATELEIHAAVAKTDTLIRNKRGWICHTVRAALN